MPVWLHFGWSCASGGGKVHAAKTPRPKTRRKTYDAACGARCKLMAWPTVSDPSSLVTVAWPPFVSDCDDWNLARCGECMAAAPGKPKKAPLTAKEAS